MLSNFDQNIEKIMLWYDPDWDYSDEAREDEEHRLDLEAEAAYEYMRDEF